MTVTFFGHRDAPEAVEASLNRTIVDLIENHGAREFYVGNNGSFDTMVRRQLELLSRVYPVKYSVVLAYLPDEKSKERFIRNSVYPEGIENVPKRFAISWRNNWMIQQSDTVVVYVTHTFGGAGRFKEIAEKKGKTVINIKED